MKLFQTNRIEIVRAAVKRVLVLKVPVCCLMKERMHFHALNLCL